jgi:dihydroxyacid dehydratase/phosphogluconate dehydratase
LAGGPIGKVLDGDRIEIVVNTRSLSATVNVIDCPEFATRPPRDDIHPDPNLPDDTRLWAAMITASGGLWGGCVYDVDALVQKLQPTPKPIL